MNKSNLAQQVLLKMQDKKAEELKNRPHIEVTQLWAQF